MITIEINPDDIEELEEAIEGTKKKLPRELNTAINATIRKVKTGVSREIRQELAATARSVNKALSTKKSTPGTLKGQVTLFKEQRLSLKAFKPRQGKRGTSYKISKTRGRKTIPGAFMGPVPGVISGRLGGHVYIRIEENERLPISKLHGISPWGLYVKKRLDKKTRIEAEVELSKQIQRRIRFILLKKQGLI